ncbi:phospholipase C, phosphocholine-specific [Achromobacter seleniivolatilans]|uniref:phospholipase C n=1 Tax=Achromobacter seleniivolatilans TaxID=3047478 RepID=A0ABY9M6P2_9BURK|nr:phospholipase C, phosphocholine-specific [Achromobacter sp. R39]WMD22674.1 phospholipase C, phosphocholine-specific [Achromobacter sp. R39]
MKSEKDPIHAGKRRFLRNAAASTAGLTALSMFPPSIRRALAIPANNRTGTINDVEHVVILMQENRSFDMYFGTFKGVRGFGDRITIPLLQNRSVWEQTNGTRVVMPYHLDSTQGNAQRVSGTPHDYMDAQMAWDGGRMYQWPRYKQNQSMGYYRKKEVEFQFALAEAFTLCDAYHCSTHGGTNTNRLFHWTGTNDPLAQGNGPSTRNQWDSLGASTTGWTWKTYPERLQESGVTWKVYQNLPENFGDNPLAGFQQYRRANEQAGNTASGSPYPAWTPSADAANPLYKGTANTMPDGGFLQALRDDVNNGTLPQVSWIVAPATYSEHPGPSSPVQGAWYIQETLDALTSNPDVWSKTVLLINFDENDGYFDHVPPPAAPSLNADNSMAGASTVNTDLERHTRASAQDVADNRVYGPGPRVPMYVVSPWSRGGWVNSQAFDHTSVLRFLEARFGVPEKNISPWRRAVLGDLTSAFNFATPNSEKLPDLNLLTRTGSDQLRAAQEALTAVPLPDTTTQAKPVQEKGYRYSRALPYELHTSGRSQPSMGNMWLLFSNTGKQAAVFHVYDRLHLDRLPRRYTVEPDKQLEGSWDTAADGGKYDLWVLGPNGYHRHFAGDLALARTSQIDAEIRVCYDIANGDVYVSFINSGKDACTFNVTPNAYYTNNERWSFTVPAGSKVEQHWALAGSGSWYDFTVHLAEDPAYVRRFAGRVETGKSSVTDPAMAT